MTQYMASTTPSCFASSLIAPPLFRTVDLPFHFIIASFHEGGSPSTASASREQEWRRSHQSNSTQTTSSSSPPPRSRQPPPRSSTRAPGRRPLRTLPPPPVIGLPTSTYSSHPATMIAENKHSSFPTPCTTTRSTNLHIYLPITENSCSSDIPRTSRLRLVRQPFGCNHRCRMP